MNYFAVVDQLTKRVLSREQCEDGHSPRSDPFIYFLPVDKTVFDALEVTRYPQAGGFCWEVNEDNNIAPLPDLRSKIHITISPEIVVAGEPATFEYTLTTHDGLTPPGETQGVTYIRRAHCPDKVVRAILTDGYRKFTYTFPDSGNYSLHIPNVLLTGTYKFTVVEDLA